MLKLVGHRMVRYLHMIRESSHKVLIKDKGKKGNFTVEKPYGHSCH